jgi:hypothetical protein
LYQELLSSDGKLLAITKEEGCVGSKRSKLQAKKTEFFANADVAYMVRNDEITASAPLLA